MKGYALQKLSLGNLQGISIMKSHIKSKLMFKLTKNSSWLWLNISDRPLQLIRHVCALPLFFLSWPSVTYFHFIDKFVSSVFPKTLHWDLTQKNLRIDDVIHLIKVTWTHTAPPTESCQIWNKIFCCTKLQGMSTVHQH